MLNIPSAVKGLFSLDDCFKNFHVHFPNGETTDLNNADVVAESVRFTESLCSQQYFKFGLSEASSIEFETVGVPNIRGAVIQCAMEIDVTSLGASWVTNNPVDATLDFLQPQTVVLPDSRYGYRVPYGEFIVDTCPRSHGAMMHRQITAYSKMPLENMEILDGETPQKVLKFNPVDWMTAVLTYESDMEEAGSTSGADPDYDALAWDAPCTSSGTTLGFRGVRGGVSQTFLESSQLYPDFGLYAVRFEYEPHPFDKKAKAMHDAAWASKPSGSFVYHDFMVANTPHYRKIFDSTAQTVEGLMGRFQPMFYLELEYCKPSDLEDRWTRYTKPIFIKPGSTYLVDMTKLKQQVYWLKQLSGYTKLLTARIVASIPTGWRKTAEWYTVPADSSVETKTTVADWPIADDFPSGVTKIYRDGGAKMYYKKITPDEVFPTLKIKNTLDFKKSSTLKKYYTYANAVSVYGLLNGTLELKGSFAQHQRSGGYGIKVLDDTTPETIPKSNWAEFWWDESDVAPIGQVEIVYKKNDDDEELQDKVITVDEDGGSLYDMGDNEVLVNATLSEAAAKTLIEEQFMPNADVVTFTPVDATIKGLPYLEAGDYIQLTAEDDETVNTFILRQEISGIQNLMTTITSTNGELLELSEEAED